MDENYGDLAALRANMVVWAKGLTRGASHAEDLVQNAMLKMLANRHLAPPIDQVGPWARVVLLNEFRTGLRSARRAPPLVDFEKVLLAAADNPETQTYCRQMLALAGDDLVRAGMGFEYSRGFKAATLRSRRHRARLALQQVAA